MVRRANRINGVRMKNNEHQSAPRWMLHFPHHATKQTPLGIPARSHVLCAFVCRSDRLSSCHFFLRGSCWSRGSRTVGSFKVDGAAWR
jgi:hypothetical protein